MKQLKRASSKCKDYEPILLEAINTYGEESQLRMLQEECAELIVAVNHYLRGRIKAEDLVEEMADVRIMQDTVRMIMAKDSGAEVNLQEVIDKKMKRLKNRLTYKEGSHGQRNFSKGS